VLLAAQVASLKSQLTAESSKSDGLARKVAASSSLIAALEQVMRRGRRCSSNAPNMQPAGRLCCCWFPEQRQPSPVSSSCMQELEALQQGIGKLETRMDGQAGVLRQHERRVLEVVQVCVEGGAQAGRDACCLQGANTCATPTLPAFPGW
jgi:hypothetical protein